MYSHSGDFELNSFPIIIWRMVLINSPQRSFSSLPSGHSAFPLHASDDGMHIPSEHLKEVLSRHSVHKSQTFVTITCMTMARSDTL